MNNIDALHVGMMHFVIIFEHYDVTMHFIAVIESVGVAEILVTRVLLTNQGLISYYLQRIRRDGDTCKRPIARVFGHFICRALVSNVRGRCRYTYALEKAILGTLFGHNFCPVCKYCVDATAADDN